MRLPVGMLSLVALLGWSPQLFAQVMFPAGAANKAVGMPSAVQSQGATATLYNPANILTPSSPGHSPYIEFGAGQITQSYEHRDFDPVNISVRTPLAILGGHGPVGSDRFGYGIAISPTGYGKQSVDGLPRRITGLYEPIYVENEAQSYDLALGFNWLTPANGLRVGASVIRRHEHRKINATQVGEDATLIKLNAHNSFYIPVLGISYNPAPWLNSGLSYQFAKKKSYKGSQKAASSEDTTAPSVRNYDPAIWRFGTKAEIAGVIGMLNLNYARWSHGDRTIREGRTSNATKADVNDIWETSVSAGYRFAPASYALLSYAYLPSPWGPGVYKADGESVIGVDIGQANNVNRRVWAVGLFTEMSMGWKLDVGAMRSFGKRELGRKADKPGYYQNEVAVITLGTTKTF